MLDVIDRVTAASRFDWYTGHGAGPVSRRPVLLAATTGGLATIAVLPFSHRMLGPSGPFVTAMLTIVACFEFLSVYLLVGDYRSQGDPRLLMMSWACCWSLVVMGGYALAFPGAVTVQGWYCGRMLTLTSSAVVLVALLDTSRRLKARAEYDAAHDQLTGLGNRRTAYLALDQMIARSRRSGSPLGVVSFDPDFFKQINDRHGHAVGATALLKSDHNNLELLRRADGAMYDAKSRGRNCVVESLPVGTRAGLLHSLVAELVLPS
jgi:hypothetical protein